MLSQFGGANCWRTQTICTSRRTRREIWRKPQYSASEHLKARSAIAAQGARVTKSRSGAIYRRSQFTHVREGPSRLHSDLASISKARTAAGESSAAPRTSTGVETLFHPAVVNWFAESFASPTLAQA